MKHVFHIFNFLLCFSFHSWKDDWLIWLISGKKNNSKKNKQANKKQTNKHTNKKFEFRYTLFFMSNAIFQLNLSVAYLFHELSFKYYLGVAWHIWASSYWDFFVFTIFVSMSRPKTIYAVSMWLWLIIWVKVFKNGTSKICGRQPLKNLNELLKQTTSLQVF